MCCVLHGNGGKESIFWDIFEMFWTGGVSNEGESNGGDTGMVV